jgi:hypothetical protein
VRDRGALNVQNVIHLLLQEYMNINDEPTSYIMYLLFIYHLEINLSRRILNGELFESSKIIFLRQISG